MTRPARFVPLAHDPASGETDFAALDLFTPVHAGIGYVYGRAGLPGWLALALAVGWEVVEPALKARAPDLFFARADGTVTPGTSVNTATDVLAKMVGWGLGQRARGKVAR